jgi:hypothetical protein
MVMLVIFIWPLLAAPAPVSESCYNNGDAIVFDVTAHQACIEFCANSKEVATEMVYVDGVVGCVCKYV